MNFRMVKLLGIFLLGVHLAACGGGGGGGGDDVSGGDTGVSTSLAVISTTPVHNSIEVDINRAITATFNEQINPGTINSNNIFVVDVASGVAVTGSVTYDQSSRTAIFRADALSYQTTYAAIITDEVLDLEGNQLADNYTWLFTTGVAPALDTTPPTVTSTFPAPNAIDVAPNAAVSVTFSEPLDPRTINSQTLTLSNGGTPVAGSVTYIGTTALFTPTAPLSAGLVYTATVEAGVKDLAGNAMLAPAVWSFTAGSQADVTGPNVLSVAPPDGTLDVPTDASLVVTFDEAIKPFEFGNIDGRPVAVTFNDTYTIVNMAPTVGLTPGVTYTATVSVRDQAGNPMAEAYVWKFSTRP